MDIVGHFKPSLSQGKVLALSRWGIVVLGLLSLILALVVNILAVHKVITALLFAYTVYTSGLILPVIAGFYKSRLKVTPLAALVAVIGGGGAALIIRLFGIGALLGLRWFELAGLLFSAVLLFGVSLIENRLKGEKNP